MIEHLTEIKGPYQGRRQHKVEKVETSQKNDFKMRYFNEELIFNR